MGLDYIGKLLPAAAESWQNALKVDWASQRKYEVLCFLEPTTRERHE